MRPWVLVIPERRTAAEPEIPGRPTRPSVSERSWVELTEEEPISQWDVTGGHRQKKKPITHCE